MRLQAQAPRALLLLVVGFLALLGLRVALAGPVEPATFAAPREATVRVDVQGFAEGFARAYLAYDSARPEWHGAAVRAYAPGLDIDGGFAVSDQGSRRVSWSTPVQSVSSGAGLTTVTVAVAYDSGDAPDYLAVTVLRRPDGSLAIADYPGFVGPPRTASHEPSQRDEVDDPALRGVVRRAMRNYLAGAPDDLAADMSPGARLTLPTRSLRLEETLSVTHSGGGRVSVALVAADDLDRSYTLRYELAVARSDRWYVRALNPQVHSQPKEVAP